MTVRVVSHSVSRDKHRMNGRPDFFLVPEYPYPSFNIVGILLLHRVDVVIKFHLAHVYNFVGPFDYKVYLGFLCRIWLCGP